jgi:hypothetical protein
MTYPFNGIIEKVFDTKGQWAARKRLIVIGGICFTATCNDCRYFDTVHIGTQVKLMFQLKGYEYKDKYVNVIQIVEGSLAEM